MSKRRVTVYLDVGLWKEFRFRCFADGLSASEVVSRLLGEFIQGAVVPEVGSGGSSGEGMVPFKSYTKSEQLRKGKK